MCACVCVRVARFIFHVCWLVSAPQLCNHCYLWTQICIIVEYQSNPVMMGLSHSLPVPPSLYLARALSLSLVYFTLVPLHHSFFLSLSRVSTSEIYYTHSSQHLTAPFISALHSSTTSILLFYNGLSLLLISGLANSQCGSGSTLSDVLNYM